ncbi:uncharacterized protein LOC128737373 isoform X2 [Sabethes cyaneus]|uniref:uncharacterized protein LOC128737373 isoform X2 n=1 Tax=Sabethes cyaneus TaxID=53552 RepID=UPI00237D60F2|nr:uncharacterized protein LOC128737373 isoform X2 [Sabethes cyaneus]
MSKFITEDDVAIGYSSEQDDDSDAELEPKSIVSVKDPTEIYIGNTGKVSPGKFFNLFLQYGVVRSMTIWRTHNHLYHARLNYHKPSCAKKAAEEQNNKLYNGKRLRVSLLTEKTVLQFPAAFRIDDLCTECTEEDIYDHFAQCGTIVFVVKTGFSAYIQMSCTRDAILATELEMILNGDPYTLSRIFVDDREDHVQVLEDMKRIRHRKPFLIVENFPALEKGTSLSQYKAFFDAVARIQHFKIAPTGNETVTLALCVAKSEDRHLLLDKFDGLLHKDKKLKLYSTGARATMSIDHAMQFASNKSSIVVTGIPPYYKDYDVFKLFWKCGEINFLEKFNEKWLICFENASAVSLSNFYQFIINKKRLLVESLTPATIPAQTTIKLEKCEEEQPKPKEPRPVYRFGRVDEFIIKKMQSIDQVIKQNTSETVHPVSASQSIESVKYPVPAPKHSIVKPNVSRVVPSFAPAIDETEEECDTDDDYNETDGILTPQDERTVYIGNLPKGVTENDLRELFKGKRIQSLTLSCNRDSFYPTASASITFSTREEAAQAIAHNHDCYRNKRVMIVPARGAGTYSCKRSVMVKNLTTRINEEGLLVEIDKVFGRDSVVDLVKPAHYYAYVELNITSNVYGKVEQLREVFTLHQIDVYPLHASVPKHCMTPKLMPFEVVRTRNGLKPASENDHNDRHFGPHNAHKLFVGNIPRDATAEDVIDYFNNFGKVVDYAPIEKKSCYLRKSAILSFINSNHAQNAYQLNHFFEGSLLELHPMDSPPWDYLPDVGIITVKSHSPFLTNDEVRQAFRKRVRSAQFRFLRFDAFDDRANLIVKYTRSNRNVFDVLASINTISDEAVLIVDGLDLSHPTGAEAPESRKISKSRSRRNKEKFLSYVVYKENLKEDMEMKTKSISEEAAPIKRFYNDKAIQINNVPMDATVQDLRNLFAKCGDITDYEAIVLREDRSKICFVTFDVDLGADLACTYNQRSLHGKRLLIHLAKETIRVERNNSILIEQLNQETSNEHIYNALSGLGGIKYIQKMSPYTAIVCFTDKDTATESLKIRSIEDSNRLIINLCYAEYDARFFQNFTLAKENISEDVLRKALTPRIRPEYHQSMIERQTLDELSDSDRLQLSNAILLAQQNIPGFQNMSIPEQINALNAVSNAFPHRQSYVNLNQHQKENLLKITRSLQPQPALNVNQTVGVPPPAKQIRLNPPPNLFPAIQPSASPSGMAMNARHVAQILPSSGLLMQSGPLQAPALASVLPSCPPPMVPPVMVPPVVVPPVYQRMPAPAPAAAQMGNQPFRGPRPSAQWVQQVASMAYNATIPPGPMIRKPYPG